MKKVNEKEIYYITNGLIGTVINLGMRAVQLVYKIISITSMKQNFIRNQLKPQSSNHHNRL